MAAADDAPRQAAQRPSLPRRLFAHPLFWPVLALALLLLGNGLGAMVLTATLDDFASSMALGIGGGLGFWLVLQLMSDMIERTERCDVPTAFRGAPILLVVAGLMGLAFLGFGGLGAA